MSYEKSFGDVEDYINGVIEEIRTDDWCAGRRVETIYLGGGTPSSVAPRFIGKVIECLRETFQVRDDAEITLEVHPVDVKPRYLVEWRSMGINRLSLGIESFSDGVLRFLGRLNTVDVNLRALNMVFEYGFDNVSIDLMYGAGETEQELSETVKVLFEFPVKHVSCYLLTIEKNTPFGNSIHSDGFVSDDAALSGYLYLVKRLDDLGVRQYEISNFAVPGYESRHNMAYWLGCDYRGFGVSSSSFVGGVRFKNVDSIKSYTAAVSRGFPPVGYYEYSLDEARMRELFVLGLRMRDGINVEMFNSRFGVDVEEYYGEILRKALRRGLLVKSEGRIYFPSPEMMFVSNSILSEFI